MKINNILTGEIEDFEELPVLKNVPIFKNLMHLHMAEVKKIG